MNASLVAAIAVGMLGFTLTLGVLYIPRQMAMRVVAAVYRVSFGAAQNCGGMAWLRSEEGIAYRKMLIRRTYAIAPHPLGPIPWKLFITEARFCSLVEAAFAKMLVLAENLAVDTR